MFFNKKIYIIIAIYVRYCMINNIDINYIYYFCFKGKKLYVMLKNNLYHYWKNRLKNNRGQ